MTRFLSLFIAALLFSVVFVGVGMADDPTSSPGLEVEQAIVDAPSCGAVQASETTFPVTAEQLLPTTGLRVCDESEEAQCPPGCFCLVIRNLVNCYC